MQPRSQQAAEYRDGDLADEFDLLAQVAQPRGSGRADIFDQGRTGRLMLPQRLEILLRKTAKEMLQLRAQPAHRRLSRPASSRRWKDNRAAPSPRCRTRGGEHRFPAEPSCFPPTPLKAAPSHGSGFGIQLTCEHQRARAIGLAGDLPANGQINWRCDSHLRVMIRLHFGLPAAAKSSCIREPPGQPSFPPRLALLTMWADFCPANEPGRSTTFERGDAISFVVSGAAGADLLSASGRFFAYVWTG